MAIGEAEVKNIIHDYADKELVTRGNCIDRHRGIEKLREDRGKWIEAIGCSVNELSKSVNGKFTKILIMMIATLASAAGTLLILIIGYLLNK